MTTQTAYDPPVESPRCHRHGLSYEPNCDFCQDASAARGTIRKWRNQAWAAEAALKAPTATQEYEARLEKQGQAISELADALRAENPNHPLLPGTQGKAAPAADKETWAAIATERMKRIRELEREIENLHKAWKWSAEMTPGERTRPAEQFTDKDWITQLKWQAAGYRAAAGQLMRVFGSDAEMYANTIRAMAESSDKTRERIERGELSVTTSDETKEKAR